MCTAAQGCLKQHCLPPTAKSQLCSASPSLERWRLPPPPDTPQKSYSLPSQLWQPLLQPGSSYRPSCFPLQSTAVCTLLPLLLPGELGQEFSSKEHSPSTFMKHTENVTAGPVFIPLSMSSSISWLLEAVPSVHSFSTKLPDGREEFGKPTQAQQVLVRGLIQSGGGGELTLAHHLLVPASFDECQISAKASLLCGSLS